MFKLGLGDVSENCTNNKTDFKKALGMGCRFGFVRATTTGIWNYALGKPTMRQDARFAINAAIMKSLGMEVMPYCWFDPRKELTGLEQASFYLNAIAFLGFGCTPVVDVENSGSVALYNAASIQRLKIWLDVVEAAFHVKPAIYSYPMFIDQLSRMADIGWMAAYPLIIAHWDVVAPRVPFPWYPGGWMGWQYTAYGAPLPYGFLSADSKPPVRICLAVWND